jgi:serine/threonine protein kinase
VIKRDLQHPTFPEDVTCMRTLGEGHFGKVCQGVYKGEQVAMKFSKRPNNADDFLEEFAQMELFQEAGGHQHVLRYIAVLPDISQEDSVVLVTELVEGKELNKIPKSTYGSNKKRLTLMYQISDGLRALHHCGIVHRDIKPANVMMRSVNGKFSEVNAVIVDFGTGCHVAYGSLNSCCNTSMCSWAGSPRYMAPEVALKNTSDIAGDALKTTSFFFAGDVYSLGVTFREIFDGILPLSLLNLINSMVDPNPAKRPTMKDVVEIIEGLEY